MAMTKPTSDQINFQNSVALPQSLTVDGTTLVVDGTNNRVGIGVAAPTTALDVAGNALITGNAAVGGNLSVSGTITGSTVGALAASLLPSGTVLQVIVASTTTTVSNLSTTTYVDTSLSATITPKRNNSRIVVVSSQWFDIQLPATGAACASAARTLRGATVIESHQVSSYLSVPGAAGRSITCATLIATDLPGTTTSTTYKTQFVAVGAPAVNQVQTSANPSYMLLVEVAA